MKRTSEEKTELFETVPIRRAAMTLVIPTVISQLVMLVYNMADTWYIGQTGNPYQVAAVTVTYPIFMMMNALANLFGIGGRFKCSTASVDVRLSCSGNFRNGCYAKG